MLVYHLKMRLYTYCFLQMKRYNYFTCNCCYSGCLPFIVCSYFFLCFSHFSIILALLSVFYVSFPFFFLTNCFAQIIIYFRCGEGREGVKKVC